MEKLMLLMGEDLQFYLFFGFLAVFLIAERLVPKRQTTSPQTRRWTTNAALTQQLRSPRSAGQLRQLAERLRRDLAAILSPAAPASATVAPARESEPAAPDGQSPDELRQLEAVPEALADASSRGEVLPMAIRFAAEIFERVAMFMVRGDSVVGMAQQGLPNAGGPDEEGLRQVELSRHGSAWFREVFEKRHSIRSAPSDGGDYTLAALLGSAAAREAYLAPIESCGEIVAILYADNLPHHRPLGDTEALDVVLQQVGLALERAMHERSVEE